MKRENDAARGLVLGVLIGGWMWLVGVIAWWAL